MDENAGHFEVVDGELALFGEFHDVWWPFDAPDNGSDGLGSRHPDAACAVLAGITVAHVVGFLGDELAAVDGVLRKELEHGAQIFESVELGGVGVELDMVLVLFFAAVRVL